MAAFRTLFVWAAVAFVATAPIVVAGQSPLLAWRDTVYITAGFAGIVGLAFLFLQPLLAGGYLTGLSPRSARYLHRWVGLLLVVCVLVHVVGLWLTSPPDVIDALLFASPTPFSAWGVVAMWTLFLAGLLAVLRRRFRNRPRFWRVGHTALVLITVLCTVLHAMLIEGTMGLVSKAVLCVLALAAVIKAIVDLRSWRSLRRNR